MYPPLNLKEVRHEYRQCHYGQLGLFQFDCNKPHAIVPFTQTETPLYFYPVCIVLIFLVLGCGRSYSNRPPQARAEQAYPVPFAVSTVTARPVYLVC